MMCLLESPRSYHLRVLVVVASNHCQSVFVWLVGDSWFVPLSCFNIRRRSHWGRKIGLGCITLGVESCTHFVAVVVLNTPLGAFLLLWQSGQRRDTVHPTSGQEGQRRWTCISLHPKIDRPCAKSSDQTWERRLMNETQPKSEIVARRTHLIVVQKHQQACRQQSNGKKEDQQNECEEEKGWFESRKGTC